MRAFSIISNKDRDPGGAVLKTVIESFEGRAAIFTSADCGLAYENVFVKNEDEIFKNTEAAIVLGGDGSMLSAAARAAEFNIPVFGINLGTIGFLAAVEKENAPKTADILLSGDYKIEKRMMLEAYPENGRSIYALNDFVASNGNYTHMLDINIKLDNSDLVNFRADGVIIASPTGATAYSLAAGGPVVDPLMECMIINAVCPHNLSTRPIVVPADKDILVCVSGKNQGAASFISDGREILSLPWNESVKIKKSSLYASLISLPGRSFYGLVRKKLG